MIELFHIIEKSIIFSGYDLSKCLQYICLFSRTQDLPSDWYTKVSHKIKQGVELKIVNKGITNL